MRQISTLETAISDHKLVHWSVYIRQKRQEPKVITARTYKHMKIEEFRKDLTTAPWSICNVFDDIDGSYTTWKSIFLDMR